MHDINHYEEDFIVVFVFDHHLKQNAVLRFIPNIIKCLWLQVYFIIIGKIVHKSFVMSSCTNNIFD